MSANQNDGNTRTYYVVRSMSQLYGNFEVHRETLEEARDDYLDHKARFQPESLVLKRVEETILEESTRAAN